MESSLLEMQNLELHLSPTEWDSASEIYLGDSCAHSGLRKPGILPSSRGLLLLVPEQSSRAELLLKGWSRALQRQAHLDIR